MMDRNKSDELPKMQCGFIDFVCAFVYKVNPSNCQAGINFTFAKMGQLSIMTFPGMSAQLC